MVKTNNDFWEKEHVYEYGANDSHVIETSVACDKKWVKTRSCDY